MASRTLFAQPSIARGTLLFTLLAVSMGCTSVHSPNVQVVPTQPEYMGGAHLTYAVWTPPDFTEDEELPLVLFLHGAGDTPRSFEQAGVADALATATRAGEMPRVVMLFPTGDLGFWRNWYDGTRHYEDWIMRELLPEVSEQWHTASCPENCHVMGVSMGGYGAMSYALHHPDRFASVTSISSFVVDTPRMQRLLNSRLLAGIVPMRRIFGPPHPISRLRAEDLFRRWTTTEEVGMPILMAWSTEDRRLIRQSSERFERHLAEHDIPHGVIQFEGAHSWQGWSPIIQQAIRIQIGGESPPAFTPSNEETQTAPLAATAASIDG